MTHITDHIQLLISGGVVSLIASLFFCLILVKIASKHHFTDNPGERKIHHRPIPIIGGTCVFLAIITSFIACDYFIPSNNLGITVACVCIMYFVGLVDDCKNLTAATRFLIELGVVLLLWHFGYYQIKTFDGIFGIGQLPIWSNFLLSMLAGVGFINGLNMIDGIDGLSTGFSIGAISLCSAILLIDSDIPHATLGIIFVCALIPFFWFNVFGKKKKMFIGDSGSMMMGIFAYILSCKIIENDSDIFNGYRISLMLAVFALPVFDTIRVMLMRIYRHQSPFNADKTHLHHAMIQIFPSHIVSTMAILLICLFIDAIWLVTFILSRDFHFFSSTFQTFIVTISAITMICGTYFLLRKRTAYK